MIKGFILAVVWVLTLLGAYVFGFGTGEEYLIHQLNNPRQMNSEITPSDGITQT